MRLRSYIALELLTGASMVAGLAAGGFTVAQMVEGGLDREAQAGTGVSPDPLTGVSVALVSIPLEEPIATLPRPLAEPSSDLQEKPLPESVPELDVRSSTRSTFQGVEDDVLLAPLRDSPIKRVKFNKGGSSISLRIDFANGARAAFKPRQTNWQSVPRREIVAFRINRLLGLESVPPATGRRFKMEELLGSLHPESRSYRSRLRSEMIANHGWVVGELSWWIPVIRRGKVGGYELDSMEGIVSWKRYLSIGAKIPLKDVALVRQISNMVLFDFIINNPDRWSGGNARVSADGSSLYFMDNTLSFGNKPLGNPKARTYFERSHTFSRSLVARLRTLQETEIRDVLDHDVEPFSFYLRDREIKALLSRRDRALAYIDALIRRHGEKLVLAFP